MEGCMEERERDQAHIRQDKALEAEEVGHKEQ
jgi:hypothetical protein